MNRAAPLKSSLPVPQLRHHGLHVRPHLLRGPVCARHVLHAEINKLLPATVLEFAIGIAPLAVFLIKGTIRLPAGERIVQWHSAALAPELPWQAQQRIDGHTEQG